MGVQAEQAKATGHLLEIQGSAQWGSSTKDQVQHRSSRESSQPTYQE